MKRKKNIFGIVVLLMLLMTGCGKDSLKEADSYNKFTNEPLYTMPLTGGWSIEISAFDEETCVLQKSRIVGEMGNSALENEFYALNRKNGEVEPIILEGIKTYNTVFRVEKPTRNRLFVLDELNADMYLYDEQHQLIKQINALDMGIYLEEEMNDTYGYEPSVWVESDSDYIYIYQELSDSIKLDVMNHEMEVIYTQEEKLKENGEGTYMPCPNISSACLFAKEQGNDVLFYQFDDIKSTMVEVKEKRIRGQAEFFSNATKYCGDAMYDCYLYDVDSTPKTEYSYDVLGVKDGTFYKLINFERMNWEGMFPNLVTDGNGGFIVEQYDSLSDENQYVQLKPGDIHTNTSLQDGKKVACIAGTAGIEELKKFVTVFNGDSKEYYIEVKDYGAMYETYEDAVKAMNLDLMNGEEIDGITLFQTDRESLIKNGYLEPLNEYLNTSTVLSKETIQDFVWNCMLEEDGTIYSIYPEFSIRGFMSKEEIDFDNLQQYTDVNRQNSFFIKQEPGSLLANLLTYSGSQFVDERKKTTQFDDEFLGLLECAKVHMGNDREIENYALQIEEGVAKAYYDMIDFPYTYYFNEYLFRGEFTCTNYGVNAPVLEPGFLEMGVLTTSDNKEAIYAFWDYMYEDSKYNQSFGHISFPILKSSWEDWKIRLTAKEDYTNRFGDIIYAQDFSYGVRDVEINIPPMKLEDVERLMNMLQKTVRLRPMKSEYIDIICEEAEEYFHGSKSAETVRDNVENRVQNALNE